MVLYGLVYSHVCLMCGSPCVCAHRLIFLGETFNGFISVHNDSQDLAKEVAVKVSITPSFSLYTVHVCVCVCVCVCPPPPLQVELLTPSHRHLLLSDPPLPQLDPGACEERLISHEVKELGEHRSGERECVLVCE